MITPDTQRYLPVVRTIAIQLQKNLAPGLDLEKMVEWGRHGLIQALNDFQKRQGMTFQAFAFYRIRGSIYNGLHNIVWPSMTVHAEYLFREKANQLLQWYSTSSEGSVKRTLEAEVEELDQICRHLMIVSLLCLESAGRSAVLNHTMSQESIMAENTRQTLLSSLSVLEDRDLLLIQKYYFEGHSMQEVASRLNLSLSLAQRAHLRILTVLKESLSHVMERRTS